MLECFGPSKLEALQHEIDSLKLAVQTKDNELERLRRQEVSQKQKEEQQTEALQAAATHVAQLEARLTIEKLEQQHISKEQEAQLRMEYEQKLKEQLQQVEQQRSALESLENELQTARQSLAEQRLAAERQRREFEDTIAEQEKKVETLAANVRQAELQRQLAEARLAEEQQKQERLVEKHNNEHTKLLRRLAAEEHRARRFQKQIASFTETMEEVSNILTAVESDHKTLGSPVKVEKRAKVTAADQLRQSIALFKRTKDEQSSDQGEGQELHDTCS